MKEGDLVTITVEGVDTGAGFVVEASGDRVYVLVSPQRGGGTFRLGASPALFEPIGPGEWRIEPPSLTRISSVG
jgi:hypothetical protein